MYIKDFVKELLPIQDFNNLYVVADFDRTITSGSSLTSWSVLADTDLVPEEYSVERHRLYDIYRPIEVDNSLPFDYRMKMMSKWFRAHIELFVKYKMTEEVFEKAATNLRVMEFRTGAQEFLTFLWKNKIPLIIISAGIGNFIEAFLKKYNCYFDNIYVSSNKILFENGIAIGVGKNIIHSFNKNEVSLPPEIANKLKGRNQVLLLGDQTSDLNMVDKNSHDSVITIGFEPDDPNDPCNSLEDFQAGFDIVCEPHENYNDLKKILF